MSQTTRNRVEVLHGVNLDMLGSAAQRALREPHHRRAPAGRSSATPASSTRGALLPDQQRGRVRRVPAPPRRARRRPDPQPRRVDPLQLRDPRRARDRGAAGRRGPPLRCQEARGVAPPLRARRARCSAQISGKGPEGYRRRWSSCEGARDLSGERAERLAALVAERGLDQLSSATSCAPATPGPTRSPTSAGSRASPAPAARLVGPEARDFITDFRYTERAEQRGRPDASSG